MYHNENSAFHFFGDVNEKLKNLSLKQSTSAPIRSHLLKDITLTLPHTLKQCNPNYSYETTRNPKRVLTKPTIGVSNFGHDNQNHDLIIHVNDIFVADSNAFVFNFIYIKFDFI